MSAYASIQRNISMTAKKYNYRISSLVKDALKKNKKISIVSSDINIVKGSKCNTFNDYKNRIVYDTQINNMFDELTNEIVSDIEACVYDYPESYISIITTDEYDEYSSKSETYLIHCP